MNSLFLIIVASLIAIVLSITPTSAPTVGRYDLQKAIVGWEPSVAIDDTNKAIYVLRSAGNVANGHGSIFKV